MAKIILQTSRTSLEPFGTFSQPAHLQEVIHTSQELGVDSQAAIIWIPRLGHQSHGKLMLKHDDGCPEEGAMSQELECQG